MLCMEIVYQSTKGTFNVPKDDGFIDPVLTQLQLTNSVPLFCVPLKRLKLTLLFLNCYINPLI